MADRIQQRRDTAARWAQFNPILLEGEVGYVTDDPNQYKIGDGVHTWNELPLRGFDGTLVHTTGDSTNSVMSQKAVSDEFAKLRTAGYIYAGIATATTNPGTPVEKVFYVATTAGTYTNFGNKAVNNGITILSWNGTSWTSNELISIKSEVGSNENAVMSQKIVSNLLRGEAASISDNIRSPYTFIGNFATWTEVQTELDKLHNSDGGADNKVIGEFRVLLDGRNLLVRNWVQNWATGVFTQTVEGSVRWNGETMEQSLQIATYERRYNEGGGWGEWKSVETSGGNMILDWKTDAATTRKQVPQDERKAGMMISYRNASGEWINEQYVGMSFDDTSWAADANWQQIGASAIELAQELSTEEGSENKAISQKAVSEVLFPLQNLGTFIELVYTEVVDGKVMSATGAELTGTDYIYAKYSIPDGVSNLKINARAYGESYPYAVLRKNNEIVGTVDNSEGGSSVVKELLIESKGADEICVNGIKSNAITPKCYYQSTNLDLITREEVEKNYVKNSRGIEHTENTKIILADENSVFTKNYAVNVDGTIEENENYDVTGYINVEGISALYMSKGAYVAVGFYKEETEESLVSVENFTSAETPINVPIQAKFARFNNRKVLEGAFTVTYIGDLTKINIDNVYAEAKTLAEYISNKISEANITPNKVFFGKRFSVIGDSISLYPYPQDGEVAENDMWWKIAIDYFNGIKDVISCSGGTSVADSTGSDNTAFVNRISTLNLSNTDVIFIEGGMNDLGFKNVELGDFDFSTLLSEQEKTTFIPAYRKMIEYIQSTYPNVKIVICTITPRNPFPASENFPWKNSTTQNTWIEYNETIRKLADCYGCYLADISKCGLTFFNVEEYTKDGVHPLKIGQNMIGQRVIMDLK